MSKLMDTYGKLGLTKSKPTGSIYITENGTYNVKDKAEAVVDVSEQIKTLDSVPDTKVADIIVVSGDYYLWKEGA